MSPVLASVFNFFETIFGKTISSFVSRILASQYEAVSSFIKKRSTILSYTKALSSQIKEMPFIYKDIELNAVDDFVDVELRTLDKKTLSSKSLVAPGAFVGEGASGKWWQLTSNRKIILMGEAGIGKTTVFRHLVLTIFSHDKSAGIYPKGEKLVPVFVPLKAVDSNSASPIMRYLTETYPQFGGSSGVRLLSKLAKKRRLILFLDGYDEIPYVGGTRFIKSELISLFSDNDSGSFHDVSPEFFSVYKNITSCRVLLSTRREFFSTYRLDVGANTRFVETRGIVNNRQSLVHKIFKRYIDNSPSAYKDKLNEELFLQRLSLSGSGEITEISYNPLFLTVLCFSYANLILSDKNPEESWRKGTFELILECINLLVLGIDKSKTRGLSADKQQALLNRRSIYPKQKIEFLSYLAGRSYCESDSFFTIDSLTGSAKEYFSGRCHDYGAREILEGLGTGDATMDIIIQLINSGVFVSYPAAITKYDFPHRRFREVLAVKYYDSEEGCIELCERCREKALSSLILYYVQHTAYWKNICLSVAQVAGQGVLSDGSSALLMELLKFSPNKDEGGLVVKSAIECFYRATYGGDKGLPAALIDYLGREDCDWLSARIERSMDVDDRWALSVSVWPLFQLDKSRCLGLFREFWLSKRESTDYSLSMLYLTLRYGVIEGGGDDLVYLTMNSLLDEAMPGVFMTVNGRKYLKILSSMSEQGREKIIVAMKERFPESARLLDDSFSEGARVKKEIFNAEIPKPLIAWVY